jgi:hypothetical protein
MHCKNYVVNSVVNTYDVIRQVTNAKKIKSRHWVSYVAKVIRYREGISFNFFFKNQCQFYIVSNKLMCVGNDRYLQNS